MRQNAKTARTLVGSMRIDRDCSIDETQQQTRVSLRVKPTRRSTGAVRLSRTATSTHAPSLKLATSYGPRPWCSERASYAALQRARARPACKHDKPKSDGHVKKAAAPVHRTRESNFEVAVYLKMARKKKDEKSRTSRHATAAVGRWIASSCYYKLAPAARTRA